MRTHLKAEQRVTPDGTKYQIAYCGVIDLIYPDNVLIVDPEKTSLNLIRVCEKCVKLMNKK